MHPCDAVTDDGQELFNLLQAREIDDVVVMGVLGRPYGIRQLVYRGKGPILYRDLTDAFQRDPRPGLGHAATIAHLARRRCPCVTCEQLASR